MNDTMAVVTIIVVLTVLIGALELRSMRERARVSARLDELETPVSGAVADEMELARQQVEQILEVQRGEASESRRVLSEREQQLSEWDQQLQTKQEQLFKDDVTLRAARDAYDKDRVSLARRIAEVERRENAVVVELERLSSLTADEARAELMEQVENLAHAAAISKAREIEENAVKQAQVIARDVLVTTIQRMAVEVVSEAVVSTVAIPGDEMKGRVIGREGRNIRTFEQVTGVSVVVDDTPGLVLLSCFDPVRREVARVALEELIADGRINPVRIEEAYNRAVERVGELCQRAAEDALAEMGIGGVNRALYPIIGGLKFRTSFGQNVLAHMVECGKIAGAIAAEFGLDVAACKRAAFFHDIGKAVVTSGDGSHALEGAALLRKYGEAPAIVNAVAAHHNEVPVEYPEAVLAQVADAVSGSRPGARRESIEAYVQRLERLEAIAGAHRGVDKAFAMQAGREIRVMVLPEEVDDAASWELARAIAREVEDELTYPGSIKVSVVRESVATETAR
ncbi:MAG: ribonuclease Y [Propionibacteriaceae bacterium]|jgi:ribonuclease Y|nr:ribonuclease Y [Propionibacteriaceae bacterium]